MKKKPPPPPLSPEAEARNARAMKKLDKTLAKYDRPQSKGPSRLWLECIKAEQHRLIEMQKRPSRKRGAASKKSAHLDLIGDAIMAKKDDDLIGSKNSKKSSGKKTPAKAEGNGAGRGRSIPEFASLKEATAGAKKLSRTQKYAFVHKKGSKFYVCSKHTGEAKGMKLVDVE